MSTSPYFPQGYFPLRQCPCGASYDPALGHICGRGPDPFNVIERTTKIEAGFTESKQPMTMPRTFTRHELLTMTPADCLKLSREDAKAWGLQWLDLMIAETAKTEALYLQGDYDQIASHRRHEIGE